MLSNRRLAPLFLRAPLTTKGWAKFNAVHIRRDPLDFIEWWTAMCASESHTTKAFDDQVGWGLEMDPDTLVLTLGRAMGPT